jgi:XTP/dITP diphosphohydrolase
LTTKLHPGDTLVIATHNAGKLREIEAMLAPWRLRLRSAADLGLAEPEEAGATFEQNAAIKAVAAALNSNLPALGDDSGLAVEALGGQPGIYSARWAGTGHDRDFGRAMQSVENKLQAAGATSPDRRRAKFVAVLCFATPRGEAILSRGEVSGHIVWPPRGDKGFGYDPIFVAENETRTFGEMDEAEKDRLSHRGRAFAKLKAALLD